jgi:L-asparaginase
MAIKKKKVTIFFTGGTISMKIDPERNAVIPGLNPTDILTTAKGIENFAEIKAISFGNFAGPQMTCQKMYELSDAINLELAQDDISAVIVTHGTDTLEETAYFLDLTVKSGKPIVVVGAMRNSSEMGYDGPANLAGAMITAVSDDSRHRGVLVVLNNEINAASEVMKMNTLSLDTFTSPAFGPLGIIDDNKAIYYRITENNRQYIGLTNVQPNVRVLKTYADMDNKLIDYCVDELEVDGLVIEAMGRGNVPVSVAYAIERAINKEIPVVICSRCPIGRVLDTYGYEGGGRHLREMGIILGGDLTGHKARLKLMLALGKTRDLDEIRRLFERGLYNSPRNKR